MSEDFDWHHEARRLAAAFGVSAWDCVGCNVGAHSLEVLGPCSQNWFVQCFAGFNGDWLLSVGDVAESNMHFPEDSVTVELIFTGGRIVSEHRWSLFADDHDHTKMQEAARIVARAAIGLGREIGELETLVGPITAHERLEWMLDFEARLARLTP